MKKALLLLPLTALALSAPLLAVKPVAAYAEEETSVSEETSVTETDSSTEGGFDIKDIVIEGKTLEQWKAELKDESTRNAAVMAIIMSLVPTLLFVIKWLTDRGVIGKTRKLQAECENIVNEVSGYVHDAKTIALKEREKVTEQIELLKGMLDKANEEAKQYRDMLETIMKTDPTLVASEAYRKYLESKDGEGKE